MERVWLIFAAASGALAVAGGAFGAHALAGEALARQRGWVETAAQYQAIHALALLAVVALAGRLEPQAAGWARLGFVIGTLLFCGALYGLALGLPRWLGALAPIGGTAFILGWLLLGLAAWRGPPS